MVLVAGSLRSCIFRAIRLVANLPSTKDRSIFRLLIFGYRYQGRKTKQKHFSSINNVYDKNFVGIPSSCSVFFMVILLAPLNFDKPRALLVQCWNFTVTSNDGHLRSSFNSAVCFSVIHRHLSAIWQPATCPDSVEEGMRLGGLGSIRAVCRGPRHEGRVR